jgi:hypothetical protein
VRGCHCGVAILLGLFSVAVAGRTLEEQPARALWAQAVSARGGRDRLHAIRSFAILEKVRFHGLMTRDAARGRVDQVVCELPHGWWEFLDYRPGLMGYSAEVVDTRTGLGWVSMNGSAPRGFLRPNTNAQYRMRQLQYVYFLETRSVRPKPVRASRVRLGFRPADRLETTVEDEAVTFFLDVNTHLPIRVEAVRRVTGKPPRPGMTGSGDLRYVFELDRYQSIAGIQVPGVVKRGGSEPIELRVEINPDYDPAIFTTPPAPDAGLDSWRLGAGRRWGQILFLARMFSDEDGAPRLRRRTH